jgi:UDP-glucose 4-epimerase
LLSEIHGVRTGWDVTSKIKPPLERVLITGGAGFIGSHLVEAMLARGQQVAIIDDLSTGRFENIAHLADQPGFRFAIESIANETVLDRLASQADLIVHLAAAVGVRLIVEKPVSTIETNVMGTESVLKAALRYRARVLLASSSEVYGKGQAVPFAEDDDVVLGPTSSRRWAYAASKLVDEFLALAYYSEKGLPVTIFRLFNTVGPRQTGRFGMVIPRLVGQALRGEPLTVYADGGQTRCFLHVKDAVAGILALADCPQADGQVVNLGSEEETSMLGLAETVLELVDAHLGSTGQLASRSNRVEDGRICFVPYEQAYQAGFEDIRRRLPDISRMRKLTSWAPRYSLRQILEEFIEQFPKDEIKERTI